MITTEIQNIFEFISFLDSNKKNYIGKYLPICEELEKLIGQRNQLKPHDNYRDKQQYDVLQKEISPKFEILLSKIYHPVMDKLAELDIWSGDRALASISNYVSSAAINFKSTFESVDVPIIIVYKNKYLNFRKETNSNFLTLELVFSLLDRDLKELFDYFKDSDEDEFNALMAELIQCNSLEEAMRLHQENPSQNKRFSIPSLNVPNAANENSEQIIEIDRYDMLTHPVKKTKSSFEEAIYRIKLLKRFIENNNGNRAFKSPENQNESAFQLVFKSICSDSIWDINSEVNNGRGPVDFTVSKGANDKTVIELKLAKSSKLKQNLQYQVDIYKKANRTDQSVIAILHFNKAEHNRAVKILKELKLDKLKNIILIDGEEKPSASNVKNTD
ncbi:PD-(D/E)XK nuclease domain-containing protein [Sphingobacterium athyrii]|uniref:PD-(D/E)XK nuclease domain-containing protein n=1 Tax=Sphingobacterium athyrii TaxID=2152717 RepID=UPI0028AD1D86|nr:PD-(D/E)XK nuclease domain-containing protein [Sphingobacterium athyrii]